MKFWGGNETVTRGHASKMACIKSGTMGRMAHTCRMPKSALVFLLTSAQTFSVRILLKFYSQIPKQKNSFVRAFRKRYLICVAGDFDIHILQAI